MDIKKIGGFIQTLRKEQNMTQKELAERLNCTDKAVSRWETGMGLPDVSILLELSKTLDVSVNEILRGEKLDTQIKTEAREELIVEKIIPAADETIVEVLKDSEEKIERKNKQSIVFYCLCIAQLLVFYVVPQIAGAVFQSLEPALILLYGTIVLCILVGIMGDKIKWLYPVFSSVSIFAAVPFGGSEKHIYLTVGIYTFLISLCIIAVCHGLTFLVKYLKNK